MQNLKKLFSELGISKVRLAKYLGVSRQMLYNYLAEEKLENWPKEKVMKILCLLGIKDVKDLDTIKVDGEYIIQVENRLNEGVKDENTRYYGTEDLKGLNKKEQELQSLLSVSDNFKKLVIVYDSFIKWQDDNGIIYISIYDFLLNENSLKES